MPIIKTNLPESSILNSSHKKYDYVDCFQGTLIDRKNNIKPINVFKAFFLSIPKWAERLVALRDRMVSVFSLKNASGTENDEKQQLDNCKCEPGEHIGILKVFEKTDSEVVFGVDDKHLNFRVSLLLGNLKIDQRKALTISTAVQFNHWFGRLYFLPVKPFHILIVRIMLKGIIKDLEKENI